MFSPGHVIFLANVSKYTTHVWYELYYQKKQMDLGQEWSRMEMECSFSSNNPIWVAWPHFEPYEKKLKSGDIFRYCRFVSNIFMCISHVFHMCCPIDTNVCTRGYPRGFNIPLCLQDFGTSVPVHKLLAHFGGGSVLLGTGWSFFFPGNVPIGTR